MKTNYILKILHLTDIHGADFLIEEIRQEIANTDLILISGDITHFGKEKEARNIIEKIRRYNFNLYALSGNCDDPDVEEYLRKEKNSLHRSVIPYKGFLLAGLSGSLPCPGTTPLEFSEMEAQEWLAGIRRLLNPSTPFVFVSHQPPFNTINDDLGNGRHVGCHAVRNFIQDTKPILCTTGHIHEGIGTDIIGNCKIINPGPFRTGKYAEITITGDERKSIDISIKQFTAH